MKTLKIINKNILQPNIQQLTILIKMTITIMKTMMIIKSILQLNIIIIMMKLNSRILMVIICIKLTI